MIIIIIIIIIIYIYIRASCFRVGHHSSPRSGAAGCGYASKSPRTLNMVVVGKHFAFLLIEKTTPLWGGKPLVCNGLKRSFAPFRGRAA